MNIFLSISNIRSIINPDAVPKKTWAVDRKQGIDKINVGLILS